MDERFELWFVLGFGWGVAGVASATIIAEWSGLALGLLLCSSAFAGDQWRDWARVFNPARLRYMISVNADIMVRSMALNAMFLLFIFRAADFGDVTLAANQILLQFLEITAYALDGFAFAAEALVGQAMGARALPALRRAALLTSLWGLLAVVLMALGFAIVGPWIIDVMTTAQEVRIEARDYLWWVVFSPIVGIAAWMLDGIYIGAMRTRDMARAALEALAVYVVAWWLLTGWFGNDGLWLALYVSFVARAVTLWWRYGALERAAQVN
jgi:MATE family multidrug resistance protein